MLKSSHRPDGKMADLLAPTHALLNCECLGQLQGVHAVETLKTSIASMGRLLTHLPRLTLAQLRPTLLGQLQNVRAAETFNVSHCPDGKIADVLAPTHACTTANASTTVGECCRDLEKFPSPQGNSRFARCLQGGGVAVYGGSVSIVNSQIYSNFGAYVRAHVQKFPSAQWDFHMFCTCACREAVSLLPLPARSR